MARRSLFDTAPPVSDPWEAATVTIGDMLEARGRERQQAQTRRITLRKYADLTPEARGPLDFDRFPWQRELYDQQVAEDREVVFEKATQIGVSTWAIRLALYHADVQQHSVLYTFPTDDELRDFSQKRIRPVIRASDHLRARMGSDHVDNVGQKQIGFDGWIMFRGTNKPIDSLDIDVAIFDEYDTSDLANIEASERRVSGAQSAGLIRRIGVPSIPGYGIDELYAASDQRVWTCKCAGCGDWNPIRGVEAFERNVDQVAMTLVCRKCRGPLDVLAGEWVATYPDRDVLGYHAPKLLIPGKRNVAMVVANSRKTKDYQRTAFFTRDLGVAYAPAEGRLAREQVEACVRNELRPVDPWGAVPPTHARRFMGIDVASVRALNVTIEEEVDHSRDTLGRKLWVGEIEDDPSRGTAFNQLCRLMDVFGINMAAIDDGPEGRFAQAFCARFPGRAYRVSFFTPGPQQKKAPVPMTVDDRDQFVSLWRTRAYDATFARFRMQQVLLPPLDLLPADYAPHLGNLYRSKTEMERKERDGRKVATGVIRVDYVKTGPEDYAQAEAYLLAAIEVFWRNVGLNLALGQGPVPLADVDPSARVEDEEPPFAVGDEPVYQSPFD